MAQLRYAGYPLYEIPELFEDEFFTIFDFTPKQRENMVFERVEFPQSLSVKDVVVGERLCEKLSPNIPFGSKLLVPLSAVGGIKFLNSEYLTPFADESADIEIYERTSETGEPYFAVKIGMCLRAIITPFDAVNKSFVDNIEKIYSLCKKCLNSKEPDKAYQIGAFDGDDDEI